MHQATPPPQSAQFALSTMVASVVLVGVICAALGIWLGNNKPRLLSAIRLTGPAYVFGAVLLMLLGMLLTLIFTGNAIAFSIGTSISATGVASLFMYLYAANQQGQIARQELFSRYGIEEVFAGRGAAIRVEYEKDLATAKRAIDALGFGMKTLLDDQAGNFAAWKERAHVRILLVDPAFPSPECSLAAIRSVEERNTEEHIRIEIKSFLERTKPLIGRSQRGSFSVRLYRAIPTVNIFRIDGALYWGPYLMRKTSRNSPTIRLREGGLLYQELLDHFNEIWNDDNLSHEPDYANPNALV